MNNVCLNRLVIATIQIIILPDHVCIIIVMTNIGFLGIGKLGMDCAEVFAEKYTVYGYDINKDLTSKSVKILSTPEAVVDLSEWIFIAVPTPHSKEYDGSVPSSHLEPKDFGYDAVKDSLEICKKFSGKKIVLISTVLPGTVRREFEPLFNPNNQFVYNPYLIAMGTVKWDFANPEMVMMGSKTGTDNLLHDLRMLYEPLMQNAPRYETGTWEEVEAIKIFYNTFISAKVGLVNMVQDFAEKIGHMNVDVVTSALANSTMRIMGPKYMTAGMGDAGACHPRDNIALRWLAQEYGVGYDLFDTIMLAREKQAKNLAEYMIEKSEGLPIVIHGKAYKPDVEYCIGSYSTLVGHYIQEAGHDCKYLDPLADDPTDVVDSVDGPVCMLMAHNRKITYGYAGNDNEDKFYCEILPGTIIIDPWRKLGSTDNYKVHHYGNTRAMD